MINCENCNNYHKGTKLNKLECNDCKLELKGREYFLYIFSIRDMSEADVAEKLGIKQDSLYKKLSGKRKLTLDEIWKLIDILDLPFETVFNKKAVG